MKAGRAALACLSLWLMIFPCRKAATPAKDDKVRGMRVNPGYFYGTIPGSGKARLAEEAAEMVVAEARATGVNTLFVQAYNSQFGAFYPTTYAHTEVEHGLGKQDVLRFILHKAHGVGMAVVAWLPVNDFRKVWSDEPSWRSKRRDGSDYQPAGQIYLLSAWHDGFRDWYRGFLADLLTRYPSLDGVEGAEGRVDVNWKGEADFNPEASRKFLARFPKGQLGDEDWKLFRAEGMTELHRLLATEAHARSRLAYVVQTWTPRRDGALMNSSELRDSGGFDFDGILNLPPPGKPDYLAAELIWQQWADAYPRSGFDLAWTSAAAKEFVRRVAGRAIPLVHVELTRFGQAEPSSVGFGNTLAAGLRLSGGTTFYDYHLAKTRGALLQVRRAYLPGISARVPLVTGKPNRKP